MFILLIAIGLLAGATGGSVLLARYRPAALMIALAMLVIVLAAIPVGLSNRVGLACGLIAGSLVALSIGGSQPDDQPG